MNPSSSGSHDRHCLAFFTALYSTATDHGSAADSQNHQIVPSGSEWAKPYLSPFQPESSARPKCSPMMKYLRKPGVFSSARMYHDTLIASISSVPLSHGRRRHTCAQFLRRITLGMIGRKVS